MLSQHHYSSLFTVILYSFKIILCFDIRVGPHRCTYTYICILVFTFFYSAIMQIYTILALSLYHVNFALYFSVTSHLQIEVN